MTAAEGPSSYLDADAGSLDSAGRRLALAEDDLSSLPERVRVLADIALFLDEFFQLTGAHLRASAAIRGRDNGVRLRVERLLVRQSAVLNGLRRRLTEAGVELCRWTELGDDDREAVTRAFHDRLLPVLVPLVAEPGKPLPPSANLSVNLAVGLRHTDGSRRFGSVELPPVVPRFLRLPAAPGAALRFLPPTNARGG